jgi:hypothetical protein
MQSGPAFSAVLDFASRGFERQRDRAILDWLYSHGK